MNIADDNGQHLSPRVGLHTAGAAILLSTATSPRIREENAVAPREQEPAEAPHGVSGKRFRHACWPAAMPCAAPRPRGGLGPHLRGGEGAPWQTRVAEPHLDFEIAVA